MSPTLTYEETYLRASNNLTLSNFVAYNFQSDLAKTKNNLITLQNNLTTSPTPSKQHDKSRDQQ
jgi:hypothetical protein